MIRVPNIGITFLFLCAYYNPSRSGCHKWAVNGSFLRLNGKRCPSIGGVDGPFGGDFYIWAQKALQEQSLSSKITIEKQGWSSEYRKWLNLNLEA